MLADPQLVPSLSKFDAGNIPAINEFVELNIIVKKENFTVEKAKNASMCLSAMCGWVLEMV